MTFIQLSIKVALVRSGRFMEGWEKYDKKFIKRSVFFHKLLIRRIKVHFAINNAHSYIIHVQVAMINPWHEQLNVDGAMHIIYSHKYNTNSAEDSSDMN